MGEFNAIFTLTDLLPLISVNLADLDPWDYASSNASYIDYNFIGNKRDDSSKGIAEGLVESTQLLDEVKGTVFESADLVHQIFVMISTKTEAMDAEHSKLVVLGSG